MRDRFSGWLVCGPLGHLAAGAGDWAALLARYWRDRLAGREPFSS